MKAEELQKITEHNQEAETLNPEAEAQTPDLNELMAETQPESSLIETLSAALLAAGRPVKPKELAGLLDLSVAGIEPLIAVLRGRLRQADLGFEIESVAEGYRLIVPGVIVSRLEPLLAPPPLPGLSPAALETLAIIAYKQPVTRGEVELMRGSSADSTLDTLQERELIKVVGRKEVVGRPMLFATTEKFLVEFGLRGLDDLPPVEDGNVGGFLRG